MSFAGAFTSTAADAVDGSSVVDLQIAFALVRHAVKQVPTTARVWMDNETPAEPEGGVLAQLGEIAFTVQPDGHLGGSDLRQAVFEIVVTSSGMEGGTRTSDNRAGGVAAAIAAALEGRSFTYTPGAGEPAGTHVLQIERCTAESRVTPEFPPAMVIVLRAMGTIDRDTGRGMLPIPT